MGVPRMFVLFRMILNKEMKFLDRYHWWMQFC